MLQKTELAAKRDLFGRRAKPPQKLAIKNSNYQTMALALNIFLPGHITC